MSAIPATLIIFGLLLICLGIGFWAGKTYFTVGAALEALGAWISSLFKKKEPK